VEIYDGNFAGGTITLSQPDSVRILTFLSFASLEETAAYRPSVTTILFNPLGIVFPDKTIPPSSSHREAHSQNAFLPID
jgi:hypothetical protein